MTSLLCYGTTETLDAGTGFTSYLWGNGSNSQTLDVATAGTHKVTVTDANGCSASDSVVVDVLTVDIPQNDTTICEGDSVVLRLNDSYNNHSLYNGYAELPYTIINDEVEFTIHAVVKVPNFNIPSSIIYRQIEGGETGLSVVNGEMEFGCKASLEIVLQVEDGLKLALQYQIMIGINIRLFTTEFLNMYTYM